MADRGSGMPGLGQPVISPPIVGVHPPRRLARLTHHPVERPGVGVPLDRHPEPAAVAAHHPADRRPIAVPTAVAAGLVRRIRLTDCTFGYKARCAPEKASPSRCPADAARGSGPRPEPCLPSPTR